MEHCHNGGRHLVGPVSIRLVHDIDVGDFHDSGLQRLDGIAGLWNQGHGDGVGDTHDSQFGLAHAHGLHNNHVVARSVQRPGNALDDTG